MPDRAGLPSPWDREGRYPLPRSVCDRPWRRCRSIGWRIPRSWSAAPGSLPFSAPFTTAAPRESCQPTSSMGSCERSTTRAASGSTQKLYSAAGVTLPSQQGAPPITTQRLTFAASAGHCRSASARLVSGPRVMISMPGLAAMMRTIASTAKPASAVRAAGSIAVIAQAVPPVKPGGILERAHQRRRGAGEDRNWRNRKAPRCRGRSAYPARQGRCRRRR